MTNHRFFKINNNVYINVDYIVDITYDESSKKMTIHTKNGFFVVEEEYQKQLSDVKIALKGQEEYEASEAKKKEEKARQFSGGAYNRMGPKKDWKQPVLGGREDWMRDAWGGVEEDDSVDDYEKINGVWKKTKNKQKRISEMTEKEWNESQSTGVGSFTIAHAKALLNSILDGTYMAYDYSDPMKKIEEQESKLVRGTDDYEKYVDEFAELLQEHFDVIFLYKNQNDYIELMNKVLEYLIPYTFRSDLVSMMIEAVKIEIELYKEPVI